MPPYLVERYGPGVTREQQGAAVAGRRDLAAANRCYYLGKKGRASYGPVVRLGEAPLLAVRDDDDEITARSGRSRDTEGPPEFQMHSGLAGPQAAQGQRLRVASSMRRGAWGDGRTGSCPDRCFDGTGRPSDLDGPRVADRARAGEGQRAHLADCQPHRFRRVVARRVQSPLRYSRLRPRASSAEACRLCAAR